MRVLVTRPEPSATRTAERLKALGHEPLLLPLFSAVHDRKAVERALSDGLPDALVVTSAEALNALGPAEALADLPVFAVGRRTAEATHEAGFHAVDIAGGDGRSLAALIAERFPRDPKLSLLYLAGEPRAPQLEQDLAERRFTVKVAVCYRMQPVDIGENGVQSVLDHNPEAILLYSSGAARRFFDLADVCLRKRPVPRILCLSAAIAAAVPSDFAGQTEFARMPDENSLFALL